MKNFSINGQELIILRLIALGYMDKEISYKMKIPVRTINSWVYNLRKKFGIDRTQGNARILLIRRAIWYKVILPMPVQKVYILKDIGVPIGLGQR